MYVTLSLGHGISSQISHQMSKFDIPNFVFLFHFTISYEPAVNSCLNVDVWFAFSCFSNPQDFLLPTLVSFANSDTLHTILSASQRIQPSVYLCWNKFKVLL